MGLSIGIVGLPNVGKSTLFNALTKNKVEAQNYPFCTIDPNVGIVTVPDNRLDKLAKTVNAQKIIPAVVEFVDIAGIVKGANKGEGLGNKFLAHIRECDAIAEVVRNFKDTNVIHVDGKVDPLSDMETIKTELILADLEQIEKTHKKLEKEVRKDPKLKKTFELVAQVKLLLEEGKPARELQIENEEDQRVVKNLNLLSFKPHIYIVNTDDEHLNEDLGIENSVKISVKTEAELADLPDEEVKEFLKEIGQKEKGLDAVIRKSYQLLGLETYFTAGEKEVRAWTFKKSSNAPQAAGEIHTDFEKGFIKAEVINWEELVNLGGWGKAKVQGKVRLEGKDYIVHDGDTMVFKFSN